jgi:hypothetical protein
VQPDVATLDSLVGGGNVKSYRREDGLLTLEVGPLPAGQPWSAGYRVIPTLAGKLNATCSSISAGDHRHDLAPTRWVVR